MESNMQDMYITTLFTIKLYAKVEIPQLWQDGEPFPVPL